MKQLSSFRCLPARLASPVVALALGLATAGAVQAQTPASFAPAVTYGIATNFPSSGIVAADVNNDGKLDLIIADNGNSSVSVLLGNGNGAFGAITSFSTGPNSILDDLGVADLNGDGNLDVITTDKYNGFVSVLLGNGNGTFQAVVQYYQGSPEHLAVADVNNDGKLDVVITNSYYTVKVMLGTGTGRFSGGNTFVTGVVPGVGSVPQGLAIADVNNDGQLDVLTANVGNSTAGVLLGTGTGSFGPPANFGTGNCVCAFGITGDGPKKIVAADVNGDSNLDLITANSNTNSASVLVGNGNGTFGAFSLYSTTGGPISPAGPVRHCDVAVADVNGDGKPDLLAAGTSTVGVLLNTTTVPAAPTLVGISAGSGPVGAGVTLTGSNLTGATGVSFNGTAAATFAVVNATTVTATVPIGASSGLVTVTTSGGTSNGLAFSVVAAATTWTGAVNNDWYTAGNWTAGVPASTLDVTIPASVPTFPLITNGTAVMRSLTIDAGAALTQTGGTMAIAADLTNNGTFQPTGGTVSLGATAFSSIVGSGTARFWNLTVGANGALLATSAGATVQRVLTLDGNFTTNGNAFTLQSNASGTAMVVNNGGNVVNGTVTVQRYIDPSLNPNLGYRHVSAAVGNATVASLTTSGFTPVVNPAYNTSATPLLVQSFPTVYGYDQSRLATTNNNLNAFDKGWFSPNTTSDPLAVGRGYTVLIGGGQTWNFTGALNNGDMTVNVARNADATAPDAGYALLGNPYPAPLDWSRLGDNDHPNVGSTMYVYKSNDPANPYTGVYSFYNNGIGTISPVLPVGQGFFVRVATGQTAGAVTFRNSQRPTAYTPTTYQRTTETRPLVELNLQAAGSAVNDAAFVYFEQGATDNFDARYDAEKLPNPSGLNLSTSLSATQRLSIDGRAPLGTAQRVVPLAVGVPAVGAYTLSAVQLLNLGTTPVYLRDLQSGAVIDLRAQASYSFTVSNASALLTSRFELVFAPQAVLATAPAALAAQVGLYPNPATGTAFVELPAALGRTAVTAELVDVLGRPVRTLTLPAQGTTAHRLPLADLATGVYTLHLKTSAGVIAKKLVVE